jgi:hypothetical protein
MEDSTPVVGQYQEYVQDLETDRRHSEEIDGHHGLDVILEEGSPGLRGRSPMPHHVLAHARLPEVATELEQFAGDRRRTPPRVFPTHASDQLAGFLNSPNPLRCQAITVSGFTITNAQRQPVQSLQSQAQKNRSTAVNLGRLFAERWSALIWWRRARFSSCSAVGDLSSDERAAANTGSTLNIERRNWRRMRNPHILRQFGVYERHTIILLQPGVKNGNPG